MRTLQDRLRPNSQEVAAKVIGGEAIMINLLSGVYYSMDHVGGAIWELIESDHSIEELVTAITARYDVSREQAEADVQRFVEELMPENLIVASTDDAKPVPKPLAETQPRLVYEPPRLKIYRDMSDLLALDPPIPGLEETPWKEPVS